MATIEEKDKLMETLKFTPRTYRVELTGYGSETVIGEISSEAYDYWVAQEDQDDNTLDDYVADWDNEMEVPEFARIFENGEWHQCDAIAHENGVEMCEVSQITVYDENNDEVWQHNLDPYNLEESNIVVSEEAEIYISELREGTTVFYGSSIEKGMFFGGDLNLTTPFDHKKLSFSYCDLEGTKLFLGMQYDSQDIDSDDFDTTGKSCEFRVIKCNAD
jgi:hypothetical protein